MWKIIHTLIGQLQFNLIHINRIFICAKICYLHTSCWWFIFPSLISWARPCALLAEVLSDGRRRWHSHLDRLHRLRNRILLGRNSVSWIVCVFHIYYLARSITWREEILLCLQRIYVGLLIFLRISSYSLLLPRAASPMLVLVRISTFPFVWVSSGYLAHRLWRIVSGIQRLSNFNTRLLLFISFLRSISNRPCHISLDEVFPSCTTSIV